VDHIVEEDADGYLGSSEGQEVNRRKQAEIVGTEAQFRRQRRKFSAVLSLRMRAFKRLQRAVNDRCAPPNALTDLKAKGK
jgi:hypothetical protein